MCCYTAPHCPREFFHGLLFPPSAEGVVKDFYNEEIDSYDFTSGKKKTQYFTQIKHFTNIVWRDTSKIGCYQTKVNSRGCVYTIIHYKARGSFPDQPQVFKENIGDLSMWLFNIIKYIMVNSQILIKYPIVYDLVGLYLSFSRFRTIKIEFHWTQSDSQSNKEY